MRNFVRGSIRFALPAGLLLAASLARGEDKILAQGDKAPAAQTAPAASAPAIGNANRPDELAQAEGLIRQNKPTDAEAIMTVWLKQNSGTPPSPYLAQGYYLQGQAQFYQKKFLDAKKTQDLAVKASKDHTTKTLAMFARADCNFNLGKYNLANEQYTWVEMFHREVTAIPHDELLFKAGLSSKLAGFPEQADYWFNKVIELYATGRFAKAARYNHSQLCKQGEGVYYRLGAGIYSEPEKANAEAEAFKKKGYRDVEVQSHSYASSAYYEVTIGKFDNSIDAKVAQEDAGLVGLKTSVRPFWALPDQ